VLARNDDLLSGTRPSIGQRRHLDLRCGAVFIWRSGCGGCRRLADDMNLTAVNNDSLEGVEGNPASLDRI
jgi:hypothetical protein